MKRRPLSRPTRARRRPASAPPRPTSAPPRGAQLLTAKADGRRPLKTLERVLSKAGLGSRVDARRWIRAGRVTVNERLTRDPDHWVDLERDRVRFDNEPV